MDNNSEISLKTENLNLYGLNDLDTLPKIGEGELPPNVVQDVFSGLAQEGITIIGEIINNEDEASRPPSSFEEMIKPSVGHSWQRILKAWIKPHNPEGTIKLMEALQVDKFLKIPLALEALMRKAMKIDHNAGGQTNYRLGGTDLGSMINFATNQTTLNEVIHLANLPLNAALIAPWVATGELSSKVVLNLVILALNTYCVLGQRYTRARLSIVIDKALSRNKDFNLKNYKDRLGLVTEISNEK